MLKAVFTDMDGTLLTPAHTISEPTKQIVRHLIQNGIPVIPISARPLHGMLPITETVFPEEIPIVSLNGSYIWQHGKVVHRLDIPLEEVKAVYEIAAAHPVCSMYYNQMNWYAHADTPAIRKEQKITPIPVTIDAFSNTLQQWQTANSSANKILMAGDEAVILELEQELLEKIGTRLNISKSQPRYVEAMHPDASKTNAMQLIMDQYGWEANEVLAIGDNYNDAGMIAFAGTGVVMDNAPDDLKPIADFITASNEQDGVAKALAHFFADQIAFRPL